MKAMFRKTVLSLGVVLVTLTLSSVYELPRGVRFTAPHKGFLSALASRISLNGRVSARFVDRILQISVPTVYAQACGKPPCDGTKQVPDPTGVNRQPYCYFDGFNYSCAKMTCQWVGGSNLCNGPYHTTCKIPYLPDVSCNYADKVSCQ